MVDARLLVVSTNPKKRAELEALLGAVPARVSSAADFPNLPEVEETGATFAENAALKAVSASRATGLTAIADDSGLEVDALGGAPGVYSARYAGDARANAPDARANAPDARANAPDSANRAKLLEALRGVPPERRTARFRCAIAVAHGGAVVLRAEGAVEGRLLDRERGDGGFGYDPLFVPAGGDRTFAEMTAGEKAGNSHRGRALAALRPRLVDWLSKETAS